MQMVVLPSSGGFAPVAPMLFTSQLTLSFLVTACSLAMFPESIAMRQTFLGKLLIFLVLA
jgi:hypothetical protein